MEKRKTRNRNNSLCIGVYNTVDKDLVLFTNRLLQKSPQRNVIIREARKTSGQTEDGGGYEKQTDRHFCRY